MIKERDSAMLKKLGLTLLTVLGIFHCSGSAAQSIAAPTVTISPPSATVYAGQNAGLSIASPSPGLSYQWYLAPSGGTPFASGTSFTTPALGANTDFYAQAADGTGSFSARTKASLSVTPQVDLTCDTPTNQTHSINGLCIGCSVSNPWGAVDTDSGTGSILGIVQGLVNAWVEQRLIFPAVSEQGEEVTLSMQTSPNVGAALALSAIQVGSYNGSTSNNDTTTLSAAPSNLKVSTSGDQLLVKFAPSQNFDRVRVTLNSGIVPGLTSLEILYAVKQVAPPVVNPNVIGTPFGTAATVTATTPSNTTVEWFPAYAGGSTLPNGSGNSYTSPPLTASTVYYAQAKRTSNGCANPSRTAAFITIVPTLTIAQPPQAARVGTAYSASLDTTLNAGTAPYALSVASGILPAGIGLSPAGMLSGTPTAAGTFNLSLQATDATGAVSAPASTTIVVSPPVISLTPTALPNGTNQSPYTGITFAAVGGTPAYIYSATGLPPGVQINAVTGALQGTPTAAGSFGVSVIAIDASTGTGAPFSVRNTMTWVVDKATQTLTFPAQANQSFAANGSFAISPLASSNHADATRPITYASTDSSVCMVTGTQVTMLKPGTCTITATQVGDGNYAAAAPQSQSVQVQQSTTNISLSSSPNPSQPGQAVTFTVSVSPGDSKSVKALTKSAPVPTGTLTLSDGSAILGTATLDANGSATLVVGTLTTVGAHGIVAMYGGDANYPASNSTPLTQTVSVDGSTATPVPLFDEWWEKLLLAITLAGISVLGLRLRRT
jgi:hypothetical protein